jgi:bifunctional polynucleotide phosphatase/kinase
MRTKNMFPTIYNVNNAVHREKMAAFDYDWTLVSPKDGKTFPSTIDDWEWLYPTIPEKIKKYYEDGFMIVIFTNQSKAWKHEQIKLVATSLCIPIFIVIAIDKCHYKPNPTLFNIFIRDHKLNKEKSFFIGDAIGRKSDFSDSDKVFAENIGVPCYCPEQVFHVKHEITEIPTIPLTDEKQIIIMMGYPGSGKSTIAKNICKNECFIYIEGDLYKSSTKMIKASLGHIENNKSIVFDATNSSSKKRKEYIELGKKYNYKVVCVHVSTPLEIAYKRNKLRNYEKYVPKIAYSVYSKNYEQPNENEGFTLFVI